MIDRLDRALVALALRLRTIEGLVAVLVFGSYTRGEYGKRSDVDLLLLFEGPDPPEMREAGRAALHLVGEEEAAHRLPMHIAPLLASVDRPGDLGDDLLHSLWADGVVLYARAGALSRLRPVGLSPYVLVRFSLAGAKPSEKVRLSRKLHGAKAPSTLLGATGLVLGPGVLLVPADRAATVQALLDEVGAIYDRFDVWR